MLRTADGNETHAGCESCYMQPVLSCLLDDMSEFLKSQMASTGILLGLLPTVVSQVGSSTIETGLLALQRPFLAFLLSAATPAVGTDSVRAFDSEEILRVLSRPGHQLQWPSFMHIAEDDRRRKIIAVVVSISQYIFATGAVVNIGLCTAELGRAAIFAMSPAAIYLPGLYILLALAIYIMGSLVVRNRVRTWEIRPTVTTGSDVKPARRKSRFGMPVFWQWLLEAEESEGEMLTGTEDMLYKPTFRGWFKHAFLPLEFFFFKEHEHDKRLYLEIRRESRTLWMATWVVRSGTICVYIFGTLMFSSILFVGPLDGLKIIARYLASAVVCRMIMVYELVGMKYTREILAEEVKLLTNESAVVKEDPEAIALVRMDSVQPQ